MLTDTAAPPRTRTPAQQGPRLKALRRGLGLTHEAIVQRSRPAARRLGRGYRAIARQNYSGIENGRLHLSKDATRAVLCAVFGVTRDEFADYLDGKIALRTLMRAREERLVPASVEGPVTG